MIIIKSKIIDCLLRYEFFEYKSEDYLNKSSLGLSINEKRQLLIKSIVFRSKY